MKIDVFRPLCWSDYKLVINMHEIREIRHLHVGLYLCCATLVFEIYVDLYNHDVHCLSVGSKDPKYRMIVNKSGVL